MKTKFKEKNEVLMFTETTLANPLRIYLNFLYYLGASPFRCVRDEDGNGFYRKATWRPQQVLCALLHIICIFQLIFEVRDAMKFKSTPIVNNPTPYFSLVAAICSFFVKVVKMKRLWFNSGDFLIILNKIANEIDLPESKQRVLKPLFLYTLYGLFAVKTIARFLGYFLLPIIKVSFSFALHDYARKAQNVFLFQQIPQSVETLSLSSITILDGFSAGVMTCTCFVRLVFSEFTDFSVFACVLTLWSAANSFYHEVMNSIKAHYNDRKIIPFFVYLNTDILKSQTYQAGQFWKNIYRKFQAIQTLSEVINIGLGSLVLWYLAEGLMFYSINLNVLLISSNVTVWLTNVTFFLVTFTTLYLSADICIQMASVKTWLVKKNNIKSVPMEEANVVLHETIIKEIGIRGNNVFTITFPFVAGYLSFIVTFFIICVQEGHSHTYD